MFNAEFNALPGHPEVDCCPRSQIGAIDELNHYIGDRLNDGVYRCLLAKDQAQYAAGFERLFAALDILDARLADRRYLLGTQPTEPDWGLFAYLVRFDAVDYPLYKCNRQRIVDYGNLWGYTRDLYQLPGVADTVKRDKIKAGYYGMIAHGGIIPQGPQLDFDVSHDRGALT